MMFSFVGCNYFPTIKPQERCFVSFSFNFGSDEEIESFFSTIEKYKAPENRKTFLTDAVSILGKGRCHTYDIMNAKRISEAVDVPLIQMDDMTGFSKETWATRITPWGNEIQRWKRDRKIKLKSTDSLEPLESGQSLDHAHDDL